MTQPPLPAQPPGSTAPYPVPPVGHPGGLVPGQDFLGPAPAAYPGLMPMLSCRLCGSVPAAATTFRGHQGMFFVMRFLRLEGPFCRDCGLGTFRHMTARTLVQGWYGYGSFLLTPITVAINLVRRSKVAALPGPQPNPFGPSRPPMNPGPRLLARPLTWLGLAVPFALLALLLLIIQHSDG